MSAPPDDSTATVDGSRLVALSRDLARGGWEVATESDRWFLAALVELDRCRPWVRGELAAMGRYLARQSRRIRFPWVHRTSASERVKKILRVEASRSKLGIPPEHFEAFADQIAGLVELVLSGRVSVEDIAFEEADNLGVTDLPNEMEPSGAGA